MLERLTVLVNRIPWRVVTRVNWAAVLRKRVYGLLDLTVNRDDGTQGQIALDIVWEPRDLWRGVYWDAMPAAFVLYVQPFRLPTVVFRLTITYWHLPDQMSDDDDD